MVNYIYLCELPSLGFYKIGYTNNPKRRLAEFRCLRDAKAKILFTVIGGKDEEHNAHHRFRGLWVSHEYYQISEVIRDWFAENGTPFTSPTPKSDRKKKEIDMELKPILVRLHEDVYEGLEVLKDRTRMSKAAICENALREYFAKHGVQLQQPKVD